MNYYERHIGDYLKDTAHLSLLEHGVYTRLLDVYYTREGGIPQLEAARLIGARSKEDKSALASVLAEFFQLRDGTHVQARAEREIERLQDKRRKASASASARWAQSDRNANAQQSHMRTDSERNANASQPAMRTHSERNARAPVPSLQSPDTNHQTPDTKREKRASAPPTPDGVDPQVWADWLTLRAKKRAPVTQTAIEGARAEAEKAEMSLDAFLRVWCRRGSQGLEAAWLTPQERQPRKSDALMAGNIAAAQRFLEGAEHGD